MTTATKVKFTAKQKREAEELWSNLNELFCNVDSVIQTIIETKAWEPIGYASFTEAWNDRMQGTNVGSHVRPYLIYQMLTEGESVMNISLNIKGVGPETVRAVDRERGNGVPLSQLKGKVIIPAVARTTPSAPHDTLHLKFTAVEIKQWEKIAARHGISINDAAISAVRSLFKEMAE